MLPGMDEQRSKRRRRDARYPARLSEALGPGAGQAFYHLVREAGHFVKGKIRPQSDLLVCAQFPQLRFVPRDIWGIMQVLGSPRMQAMLRFTWNKTDLG